MFTNPLFCKMNVRVGPQRRWWLDVLDRKYVYFFQSLSPSFFQGEHCKTINIQVDNILCLPYHQIFSAYHFLSFSLKSPVLLFRWGNLDRRRRHKTNSRFVHFANFTQSWTIDKILIYTNSFVLNPRSFIVLIIGTWTFVASSCFYFTFPQLFRILANL
jgi:hypothetical protein